MSTTFAASCRSTLEWLDRLLQEHYLELPRGDYYGAEPRASALKLMHCVTEAIYLLDRHIERLADQVTVVPCVDVAELYEVIGGEG